MGTLRKNGGYQTWPKYVWALYLNQYEIQPRVPVYSSITLIEIVLLIDNNPFIKKKMIKDKPF